MSFVKIPYLPQGRVIVGVGDIAIEGVKTIKPYTIASLSESMQHHADLSFCYLGDAVAVCAPEAFDYYSDALDFCGIKLIKGEKSLGSNYPYDAAYNVAIVGKGLYCKTAIADKVLLKTAESMGYRIHDIKQGYAKCSVCPVDEKSAISADMSFYKRATEDGVEVLLITNEGIRLDGFANGFFGGCSYMPEKGVLEVKGDITTLPQHEKIEKFLAERGISVGKGNGEVIDFGSFIPIVEE